MKKFWTKEKAKRWGLKILSLFLAVILWLMAKSNF
jgi:YbbR domain-containing protein